MAEGEKIVVAFQSISANYVREKDGRKSNTVRTIYADDDRFPLLASKTATHIRIMNAETHEVFERKITDVTLWNGEFIISWNPNEQACADERMKILLWCEQQALAYYGEGKNEEIERGMNRAFNAVIKYIQTEGSK